MLMHAVFLVTRPMILGVKAAAFDDEGRIFLVRHTYVSGWHLPGGGVERMETAGDAVVKELREEANIDVPAPRQPFAIYFNRAASRFDHVLLYRFEGIAQTKPRAPDREIAEAAFFSLDALPEDTTGATRRRIDELVHGAQIEPYW